MYYICQMTGEASAQVGGHYGPALDTLRGTIKWLVASAGAVAAAIIAGAQVVDYSDRSLWGAGLAAGAVAAGLALTLLLLGRAANILTIPRPTATDLANAEIKADAADEHRRLSGQISDPDVEWLLARTTYLLGGHDTVSDLLAAYTAAQAAAAANPGDDAAQRSLTRLNQHIGTVEEAAHFRDMSKGYNTLMRQFPCGAAAFVIAAIVFAVSGLLTKPAAEPMITQPLSVEVNDISPEASPCSTRSGVAIAGTLTAPTVVMPSTEACPAATFVDEQPNIIVIPQLPDAAGGRPG
jgi:hypothetical protein